MKRAALTLSLIFALLISAVEGIQLINFGLADPFFSRGMIPPPEGTEPPIISIFSPKNNTVLASNDISLSFNVSISKDTDVLTLIHYETDWKNENTSVYPSTDLRWTTQFSYNGNLSGITEGIHRITVFAEARGSYIEGYYYYYFYIWGSSSTFFSIDSNSPIVSVLSPQNMTYAKSGVHLNFTVSETPLRVFYNLDGKGNVSIFGNTTLTGLTVGLHSLTVYATDEAGNTGATETIYFTVALPSEPFPTTWIAAALVIITIGAVAFLVYFKRIRKTTGKANQVKEATNNTS